MQPSQTRIPPPVLAAAVPFVCCLLLVLLVAGIAITYLVPER
jgi:hypothetical protein